MRQPELRKLIEAARDRDRHDINYMKDISNPQIVAMVNRITGRIEAYESVLAALDNDRVFLKIAAG